MQQECRDCCRRGEACGPQAKGNATEHSKGAAWTCRQLLHGMQELDVQNAAALEKHSKDMAEHEAQVAEAAAAWEADKKKKKGKAKDEVG